MSNPHDLESGSPKSNSTPYDSRRPSTLVQSDSPSLNSKAEAVTSWEDEPENAQNWPKWRKVHMIVFLALYGFLASLGTSIISPAADAFVHEFGIGRVVSLLPLSLYVFALAFGPVLGGPLSETVGRRRVYQVTLFIGSLFALGAGLTHNFVALCILRFATGLCWGPALSIGSGTISETFVPKSRGLVMAIFILMPFLGPGLGPVIGSFVVSRKGWRWTQWTLLFFALTTLLISIPLKESYPSNIKRTLAKQRGQEVSPRPPAWKRVHMFLRIGLIRPIHMVITEPLVTCICLYASMNFGILFSFFAAIPYTFHTVYGFTKEQSGLVFVAVAVGCALGLVTTLLCDRFLYRPQVAKYPPHKVPPEYRLFPAMIGGLGLPISLFWYAWTARSSVSWISSAVAIVPFGWGVLCVFVPFSQYLVDTYKGTVVASAASANGMCRYAFAGAFPLFIVQMLEAMHISWALSLFGFVSIALLPIPWIFYKFGPQLRAKSSYEVNTY